MKIRNGVYMENHKKVNMKYTKLIGNILVVIALIFLIRKFYTLDINISDYYSKNNVIIAFILFILFSFLLSVQSLPWIKIVRRICDIKLSFYNGNKVYCKSSLYKYIPGNIFQYVGRSSLVFQFDGINYSSVLGSIIIETLCVITSSIIVSLVFCWNTVINYLSDNVELLLIIVISLIAILTLSIILRHKIQSIIRKNKVIINKGLILDIIFSIFYFSLILFIQGGMLAIIINQLNGTSLINNILLIIGTYSLSWVIGYITPGASGGIGVREALLCLFLGNYFSEPIILVSVIMYRILNILSDLVAYLLSYLLGKKY